MYPYNRALKRNRRQRKSQLTEAETQSNMSSSTASDGIADSEVDIVWDPAEYKLTYVLEHFRLPQIVRVVEGFMLTEDDCLASGTVLTIHDQQTIEQVSGIENNGLGRDINISLSCPYKVKVTVPDHDKNYRSVKDLCNTSPLPKCVILGKKVNVAGHSLPAGQCLIVNSISRNHMDEAFGLLVSRVENELQSFVLPLNTEGRFSPCPFPRDQSRCYFIRELVQRPFPLFVHFVQSGERQAPYGPHMGIVKLTKLMTFKVVFATSIIDSEKYAISFSRDLPVTIEVARGMLDNSATYVRKCKAEKAKIDLAVLSHLTESSPYTVEFNSLIYNDIKALQELNNNKNRSTQSSDNKSVSSDFSLAEDMKSFDNNRYIISYRSSDFQSGNKESSCSTKSHEEETPSLSSVDNVSIASSFESGNNTSSFEKPRCLVDSPKVTPVRIIEEESLLAAEYDSENDGYEKVVEWMDRPDGLHIKQSKTSEDKNHYSYADCRKGDPQNMPPPIKPRPAKRSSTLPPKKPPKPRPNRILSADNEPEKAKSHSSVEYLFEREKYLKHEHLYEHVPESLNDGTADATSDRSDEISIASEYMSVKSDKDCDCFPENVDDLDSLCSEMNQLNTNGNSEDIPRTGDIQHTVDRIAIEEQCIENETKAENEVSKRREIELGQFESTLNNSCSDIMKTDLEQSQFQQHVSNNPNTEYNSKEQTERKLKEQGDTSGAFLNNSGHHHDNTSFAVSTDKGQDKHMSVHEELKQLSQEGVCSILENLNLFEFTSIFQENQINGELLIEISADEFVSDLGLSIFQAKKLLLYVRGWRPIENGVTVADDVNLWTVNDVHDKMLSINLKSFAQFCAENQVDGTLLSEISDEKTLQCLKDVHGVQLSSFEMKKLRRFVIDGWRPDGSIKR